jgi:hypothetical protein
MATSKAEARTAGTALASAPMAPAKLPATLYHAKSVVRGSPEVVCASATCSVGKPHAGVARGDGLSVPSVATTARVVRRHGQRTELDQEQ